MSPKEVWPEQIAHIFLRFFAIPLTINCVTKSLRGKDMTGRFTQYAFALVGLLASGYASAQTASPTAKDVTEVVIKGQQNASNWFRAESQHFIVFSDAREQDVSQLLNKLERFDYLLRLYTKADTSTASEKTTLFYMAKIRDLNQIDKNQPAYAIGLYNSCALGVQGFGSHMYYRVNSDRALEKQPENEGLAYIFEAYARHFLYRHTNLRTPTWYIDGFAQYFASTRFSDTETLIGIAPKSIGSYLAFMSNGHRRSLDYTDILLQNDSKGQNYAGVSGVQLEFQARSWVLTHYILSSNENIQYFRNFIALGLQGVEPTKAFEQAFGFKASKLNNVLWKYRLQTAKALKLNLTAGGAGDIQFSALPASADNLILADAALKACPNPKVGESLLQKIRKEAQKFPQSDFAEFTLARAEIEWGNPQAAIPFLSTQTRNKSVEAFYLLGLAHLKLAEQNQAEEHKSQEQKREQQKGEQQQKEEQQKAYLESAQANLVNALALNPQSAEASYAYFRAGVQAQAKPSNEILRAAITAAQLQPEVSSYNRAAALSHAYLKQLSEVESTLSLLAANSRDPHMAEWAKTWQTKFNTGVTRAEILAEMRLELVPAVSFKEWTIANYEVMQAVELAAGLQAAEGFILDQQQQNPQAPEQGGGGLNGRR
jgi:hypothetical protein